MGFFDGFKPKVSGGEFHKVKVYLFGKGFSSRELTQLEGYFHGDLHEGGSNAGISESDAERPLNWLREHRHHHTFNDGQIDLIDHAFKKYL